jgi:DNA-binding MarR family transcriptional regulator
VRAVNSSILEPVPWRAVDDPLDEELKAVRTLARLARLLERSSGGLTLAQYRVLAAVDDGGERATHLAHALALAKPTVTAAVDGLVERGLLEREPVPGDRRSLRIGLTPAGRETLREAEAAMARRLREVVDMAGGGRDTLDALGTLAPALDALRAAAMGK